MVVNDRKTWLEHLKDNFQYIMPITFVVSAAIYASVNSFIDWRTTQINNAEMKKQELIKLDIIKSHKQALVCKEKYFAPDEYDVVSIGSKFYVETVSSVATAEQKLEFKDCVVYNKITSTIKIPEPISYDTLTKNKIENLENSIKHLTDENKVLKVDNNTLKLSVDSKTAEIRKLVTIIDEKQSKIEELSIYSVKYAEVKELLSLTLSNQGDKLQKMMASLIEKPIKPKEEFTMKSNEKAIVKNALTVADNKPSTMLNSGIASNNMELEIKLRIYVVKEMSKRVGRKESGEIPKPDFDTLKAIKVTAEQLKKPEIAIGAMNKTIETFSNIMVRMGTADKDSINKNLNAILQRS